MQRPQLPPDFENVLLSHIKHYYLPKSFQGNAWNSKDIAFFAKGIVRLNAAFTSTKSQRDVNYFQDPVMRSGYLAYFLPVNAVKVMALFAKVKNDLPKKRVRILDIGSGPLTLVLGYLFHLQTLGHDQAIPSEIEVVAVEQNEKILKDGITLIENYLAKTNLGKKTKVKIKPLITNALRFKSHERDFDLILIGNFLNEISERDRQSEVVLNYLSSFAHAETMLFMLEPASKKISRDLQALRDDLLAETPLRVLAPCLHQHQCPLNLTAKGDWCNFTQEWMAPKFIQDFDRLTHLKKNYLLYSYLILKNSADPKHTTSEFVAISNTMREHGRLELIGCGEAGRIRFVRSNKNRSEENKDFESLARGHNFHVPHYQSETHELNKIANIAKHHVVRRD